MSRAKGLEKTEQMSKSATVSHDQIKSPLSLTSQEKLVFTLVSSPADLIMLKWPLANLGKCMLVLMEHLLVAAMMGQNWVETGRKWSKNKKTKHSSFGVQSKWQSIDKACNFITLLLMLFDNDSVKLNTLLLCVCEVALLLPALQIESFICACWWTGRYFS